VRVTPGRDAPFDAEVVDVAPDGALVVSTADGRTIPLASAEITLRAK
jgi:biotin-(acetyl-CoA carboxylase) ligase